MIWAIAILLVLGVMYVSASQKTRSEAEMLAIARKSTIYTTTMNGTFPIIDGKFQRTVERARLQLQTGKVLLAIGLILMAIKVAMELFK